MLSFSTYVQILESYKKIDYTRFIENADNDLDIRYFTALAKNDMHEVMKLFSRYAREKFKDSILKTKGSGPKTFFHGSTWDPLKEPDGKAVFNKDFDRDGKNDSHKLQWGLSDFTFYFSADKNLFVNSYGNVLGYFLNVQNPAYSDIDVESEMLDMIALDIDFDDQHKTRRHLNGKTKRAYDWGMSKSVDNAVFPGNMPAGLRWSGAPLKKADAVIGRGMYPDFASPENDESQRIADEIRATRDQIDKLYDVKNRRLAILHSLETQLKSLSVDDAVKLLTAIKEKRLGRQITDDDIAVVREYYQTLPPNFSAMLAKPDTGRTIAEFLDKADDYNEYLEISDQMADWGKTVVNLEDKLEKLRHEHKFMKAKHMKKYDIVVVKDPTIIKLASPVTFDHEGNPIPLSQRFDFTNPDVRW